MYVCIYMHITKINERRGNAFERLLEGSVWREKKKRNDVIIL